MTFNSKLSLNILVPSFSLTICAGVVQAACVAGDCSALGYTQATENCSGNILHCPFDKNKVICKEKPSCTEEKCTGFPLSDCPDHAECDSCTKRNTDCSLGKTSYKVTSCTDGYVQNGNSCESPSSSPSPCADVVCTNPGLSCQYGCKTRVSSQDGCCSTCTECNDKSATGCRTNCTPTNRKTDADHSCWDGVSSCTTYWDTDNCGCEYAYTECRCESGF